MGQQLCERENGGKGQRKKREGGEVREKRERVFQMLVVGFGERQMATYSTVWFYGCWKLLLVNVVLAGCLIRI